MLGEREISDDELCDDKVRPMRKVTKTDRPMLSFKSSKTLDSWGRMREMPAPKAAIRSLSLALVIYRHR